MLQRKIKLGFFDDSPAYGGTTRYLAEIIASIDRDRFDPVLFDECRKKWHAEFESAGVPVICVRQEDYQQASPENGSEAPPASRAKGPRQLSSFLLPARVRWTIGMIRAIFSLRALFRQHRVDILLSNNNGCDPGPVAGRLARIPVIINTWHIPVLPLNRLRGSWWYRWLDVVSTRCVDRQIAVSESCREGWIARSLISKSAAARIQVIPIGVDARRFTRKRTTGEAKAAQGIEPNTLLVGALGRLCPQKGFQFLVRAAPSIRRNFPSARILIGGAGEDGNQLRCLARELGVDEMVTFTGFVSDGPAWLEMLDVYVQPSLWEAHATTPLEAAAMGLPVVGTNIGGISESLDQGVTGLLVPPEDPDALASAVNSLLGDSTACYKMGQAARLQMQEHFRLDDMISDTLAVIQASPRRA